MASNHLKDLLSEDQEPFVLKNHIHEKLHQLKQFVTPHKSHLQIKTRKPISQNSSISNNFRKNACFFSSTTTSCSASPDVRKSSLFDFRSPMKSPCINSNALFFHIPARTAALLLEAALRIQKNSVSKKAKSRKIIGFGLFGSILKRLTSRKRNQKIESSEVERGEKRVFVKDIIRWDSSNSNSSFTEERLVKEDLMMGFVEDKMVSEMGFSCSCTGRLSSVWSESNEEKSFDLETSSSRSDSEEDSVNMEFLDEEAQNADFSSCEKEFCSSPFHVVLNNNSLSPCRRSPKFDTPKRSPIRNNQQEVENENRSLSDAVKIYEEEEKEQNSPVCVLDPPFEDDDDDQDDEEAEDCFELEHNFAAVQRAKQQILHKLRRFERLAELDPVELVKRIEDEEDNDREFEEQYGDNDHFLLVRELLTQSNMYSDQKIPSDMQRLVSDLVAEEGGDEMHPCSRESVAENVCERLESWKEVGINTIDMMVGFDFRRDANEWAKNPEQVQETAVDIELAIFDYLVEELSDELVQCSSL